MWDRLAVAPEVQYALAAGKAVVALESSVLAQGLPPPHNLEAARRCEAAVRASGATPATVAVLGGKLLVGATERELAAIADPGRHPAKAGVRDLPFLLAAGKDAGTTVSATCAAAARAGIRLFATGGIGGVHREPPGDVSSDLAELARSPVCVVCAGPKAILDVPATAEALESLGVPVVGWRTGELPAFYAAESGVPLEHRLDDATAAARWLALHFGMGRGGALLAVPPPAALPRAELEAALASALAEARTRNIRGKAQTPFLLAALAEKTGGRSLDANLALLEANARVAAEVAVALATFPR